MTWAETKLPLSNKIVSKQVRTKIISNYAFHNLTDYTEQADGPIIAWTRSIALFEDRNNVSIFPLRWKVRSGKRKSKKIGQWLRNFWSTLLDYPSSDVIWICCLPRVE